ncbi:MAG: hypothetical protein ABSH28_23930 [Acidobacteriota bacterium]|jgi:hypothetical protein
MKWGVFKMLPPLPENRIPAARRIAGHRHDVLTKAGFVPTDVTSSNALYEHPEKGDVYLGGMWRHVSPSGVEKEGRTDEELQKHLASLE